MPSLLSDVTWVHQVMDVVERGLIDERVEVRSKAGQVLGGLLHCAFVDKERQDSLLVSLTILICPLKVMMKRGFKRGLLFYGWNACKFIVIPFFYIGPKRDFSSY